MWAFAYWCTLLMHKEIINYITISFFCFNVLAIDVVQVYVFYTSSLTDQKMNSDITEGNIFAVLSYRRLCFQPVWLGWFSLIQHIFWYWYCPFILFGYQNLVCCTSVTNSFIFNSFENYLQCRLQQQIPPKTQPAFRHQTFIAMPLLHVHFCNVQQASQFPIFPTR